MNTILSRLLVILACLLCLPAVAGESPTPALERGVLDFFAGLKNGGTLGVDQTIQLAYVEYDKNPSSQKIETLAGIDIAAYVFKANLSRPPQYSDRETDALIQRLDQRLARYDKNVESHQVLLVS